MNVFLDQSIPFVETKYITKYVYYLHNLVLNQEVTIIIDYYGRNEMQIYQSIIKLTGERYTAWGSDDAYILNIVSQDVEKVRNGEIVFRDIPVVLPSPLNPVVTYEEPALPIPPVETVLPLSVFPPLVEPAVANVDPV